MNPLKALPLIGAVTLLGSGCTSTNVTKPELKNSKPNFVFIFADDLGWRDVGFNGSKFYETPSIDKLASEGMQFTNAYANAANCLPSRACLLSGQYTPRHGAYAVFGINRGKPATDRLYVKDIPESQTISPETVTFAEALKSTGYATACIGKWHLEHGYPEEHAPQNQGFDKVLGKKDLPKFKETNDPKNIYKFTEEACNFIEENKDKPFFLYLPHDAVHTAIEAREEMIEKYKGKTPVDDQKSAQYAALVEHTDDSVGLIMKKLKDLNLDDNTFVVFFSDNGGMPFTPQTPLRGHKGMYYEGGIREPMVVRWPGKIKAGTKCDKPISSVDFYPTFLELAGVKKPNQVLDGESILPLLKGEEMEKKPIFWHFPGYLAGSWAGSRTPNYRSKAVSVIRKGDFKLLLFHEEWVLDGGREKIDTNKCVELYNIKEDMSEKSDIANSNKVKRDELLSELLTWIKDTKAPISTKPNPNFGKPVTKKKKKGKKKKNK